ncbi:MAG: hypothetical protein RSE00_00590 [Clostridia bacterium]
MASLILHTCIAKLVKDRLELDDRYYIGNILPGILCKKGILKAESHYMNTIELDGKVINIPDIDKFERENKCELKSKDNSISLGYLSHLLQDKIWYEQFIPKFVAYAENGSVIYQNDNTKHTLEEFLKDIYLDYAYVDKYIIQKYNVDIVQIKKEMLRNTQDKYFSAIDKYFEVAIPQVDRINSFITVEDTERYLEKCLEATLNKLRKYGVK